MVSTYNGEAYIKEQLDSLLNQVGVDVHILIRDDGSIDSTVSILNEYSRIYENIDYYAGENKGVIESFNELLMRNYADLYKYIAFCDQDDVWDKDKLLIAVAELEKHKDVPAVYCSNLKLVDEKLCKIGPMRENIKIYSAHTAMIQNIGTGCTQVFNHEALELYKKGIGSRMEMHDYWMTLVCMFFGTVVYDELPHISYRQHRNNAVGAKEKKTGTAVKNLKIAGGRRVQMLEDFLATYELEKSDMALIHKMIHYDNSILNRLGLALSFEYIGFDPKVTIGFKIRALLGNMY